MTVPVRSSMTTPQWVLDLYAAIDDLSFGPPFRTVFTDRTDVQFGATHLTGADATEALLRRIDEPLDTEHPVHECWQVDDVLIVRGEAVLTPKGTDRTSTAPFTHIFYLAAPDAHEAVAWHVTAGPFDTSTII